MIMKFSLVSPSLHQMAIIVCWLILKSTTSPWNKHFLLGAEQGRLSSRRSRGRGDECCVWAAGTDVATCHEFANVRPGSNINQQMLVQKSIVPRWERETSQNIQLELKFSNKTQKKIRVFLPGTRTKFSLISYFLSLSYCTVEMSQVKSLRLG